MLGRPVVTAKQMAALKTRFRKAEERVEQRAADGGAAGEMDIGSFLAERVLSLRAAFDTRAFLRAQIARVDASLYAVARSPALELVGGLDWQACLRTSACACMRASMLKLCVSVLAYIRIHTC